VPVEALATSALTPFLSQQLLGQVDEPGSMDHRDRRRRCRDQHGRLEDVVRPLSLSLSLLPSAVGGQSLDGWCAGSTTEPQRVRLRSGDGRTVTDLFSPSSRAAARPRYGPSRRLRASSTDPRFRWRQFWFCLIKVITIIGLVILGIILTAGGGPSGQVIGGRYWCV